MKEYRPSNKVAATGLVLLAVVSILGGILIGGIAYVASQFFYLVFLFTLGVALVGVMTIHRAVEKAKVSNPLVAGVLGLLMGFTIYGAYHYADYLVFRREIIHSIQEEHQVDSKSASRALDHILIDKTGAVGFWGFMVLNAREGETFIGYISFHDTIIMSTPDLTLKSGWAWLYWFLEAALITVATTWAASTAAKRPFCKSGSGWYGPAKQIGNVENELAGQFLDRLQGDNFLKAGELVVEGEKMSHPTVEVYVQHCPTNPTSDVLLTLKHTFLNSKSDVKREVMLQGEISADQYLDLAQSFASEEVG